MAPVSSANGTGGSSGVCTTPMCIHAASEILWNLAPNYTDIDPCTDFDKYTCDGWRGRNDVPAGYAAFQVFSEQKEQIEFGIKKILEGPYPNGTDGGWITVNMTEDKVPADKANFAKLQSAYNTCINATARQDEGFAVVTEFIEQIIELFPAGLAAFGTDLPTNMGRTIAFMESYGIPTFQSLFVNQLETEPEKEVVTILPATFSDFPKTTDLEVLTEYATLTTALYQAAHPGNISDIEAGLLVTGVVELVTKLALAQTDPSVALELAAAGQYQPTVQMDQLQLAAPNLNYAHVIKELAPDGYTPEMVVTSGALWANVSLTLANTTTEVIQGFFIWRALVALAPYVETDLADAFNSFSLEQQGRIEYTSQAPRWQKCVRQLDSGVSWIPQEAAQPIGPTGLNGILVRFWLDKHYSQEAMKLVGEILNTTIAEFTDRIDTMSWISPETKEVAKDKARKVLRKVGVPTSPDVVDPVEIQALYSGANISASHVNNTLEMVRVAIAEHWTALGRPADKQVFLMSTTSVNAYYAPWNNEVSMLAGLQQYPIFDYDYPTYLSYGGMGSIVTHELIHGFDNRGRQFDATGNHTVWWDNSTILEFENRTQCFVEQFNNFTVASPNGTRLPVNGQFTLGENIADTGGVVGSFAAWKRWEREHGRPSKKLPGLDKWTNEQLFFIKWGQNWCDVTPPKEAARLLTADNHSPNFARIKGPVANSREFLEAFNCPVKEPKCELW